MLRFVTDAWQRLRDRVRRRLAMWRWDRPNSDQGSFDNRIVFVRWDAKLGDTIVLSWVFRALKRQRPDLEITVITASAFEDLFRHGYGIDSVFLAGKRHGGHALAQIAQQIKRPRYVVHLSLRWRPRDLQFVRQLDPEHVVGLDDALQTVDIKLGQRTQGVHFSEKLIPWLKDLGVDTSDRRYWIPRLPEATHRVDQWWPKGKVVGLCPFGASRKKHLNDRWIERIVQRLLDEELSVVFLVLASQKVVIERLITKNQWRGRCFLNPLESTQYDLFEQVARCDGLVSVDTAVVHIAVGFNRPLLAIYNSVGDEFENWRPNGLNVYLLRTLTGSDPSVNALEADKLESTLSAFAREVVFPKSSA